MFVSIMIKNYLTGIYESAETSCVNIYHLHFIAYLPI
jgi:hypothetical protein